MTEWNFADVYEAVAAKVPDRPCQVQGDRVITWGQFDARADALAADMLAAGLGHQSKVAAYLYNCPEYLETYIAAFKGGFAPVNTNYRYGHDEIVYLFDNADAEAVVFHAAFADLVEHVRHELPKVKRWYCVDDGTAPVPGWALDYEEVVSSAVTGPVRGPWGRSPDDLLLLYTGGTTGMPKGVMWRQDDLFNVLGAGGNATLGIPPAESLAELASRVSPANPGLVLLSACPLMHGTGQFSSLIAMNLGGTIVTLPSRHFDVAELFGEVQRNKVNSIIIVGQAFAGPMLEHLDANPDTYDLTSVLMMSSSGVMWSQDNKEGLLRHMPQAALFDSFGSSEAVGMGASVSTAGGTSQTARFMLGPSCQVFTEDGRRVAPGSGERGLVSVGGFIPVGYYKDPEKSAQTFRTFEGQRWSVPGDWAEVNEDGTLLLLGRGSVCINTGGEKVFPEEVEEALKQHASVRDAVVVGLPDNRFGETICAVVEATPGVAPDLPTLADHVKEHLAHYKAPRHLVVVDTIGRAPNGKVDYKRLKGVAIDRLGGRLTAEVILYACPAGPLAVALGRYYRAAATACGPNTAHEFPPHVTLTGFFHDTAPDWAAYRRALAGAVRRAGPPPEPAVRVSGLLLQDDVHLLAVDSPWLCSVAAHFAHTAPAVTRTDGIRLKDRLHLSLAYGFDPAAAGELGGLAEEWVDPLAPASWQIRLYHRRAGAEWIVRESLDVGSRQV